MNINSTIELLENIKKLECLEKKLICEENELLSRIDNCFIISRKKNVLRSLAHQKRNEIINANVYRKYYTDIFSKYSRFSSDLLIPFLINQLTEIEKEEYTLVLVNEKDFLFDIFNYSFNIITTKDNEDIIMKKFSNLETENIDDVTVLIKDNKYLCLETDQNYALLDGPELSKEFIRYPYLKDIAYTLIDMKLCNPTITDEERLDSIKTKIYIKKKV